MHPFSIEQNTLLNQVVHSLEQSIKKGYYRDYLPGERSLSEHLNVSRSIIRKALKLLQQRQIIEVVHGKRTCILAKSKPKGKKLRTVGVLAKGKMDQMSHSMALGLLHLQKQLNRAGYSLNLHFKGSSNTGPSVRVLRQLLQDHPADCWVVYSGNPKLQQFFNDCGLPVLIKGKPNPGINLPHTFVDQGPACRHAVGRLLACGHRKIAMLVDETQTASHNDLCMNFKEAFTSDLGQTAEAILLTYTPSKKNIWEQLSKVFRKLSSDPTALILDTPSEAMTSLSFLANQSIAIPSQLSLICMGEHPIFSRWQPRMSFYSTNEARCNARSAKLVLRLATEGSLPGKDYTVIPEYVEGETVAPPMS